MLLQRPSGIGPPHAAMRPTEASGGASDAAVPAVCADIVPSFVRATGEVRASFALAGQRTVAARVFEQGGLRLRFPKAAGGCEAVIINTGGGMAGGDTAKFRFEAGQGAAVMITTQSAEKVYRSQGPATNVDVVLSLGPAAKLEFLPQETILFDAARLSRRFAIELAADASLTVAEAVVFGRVAMGEKRPSGSFRDRWRIRRGGSLVLAEDVRLEGDIAALLDRPACGAGARAIATFVHLAPDAEAKLEQVRAVLAHQSGGHPGTAADRRHPRSDLECGASAWNGVLITRFASALPERVRAAVAALLEAFRGRPLPRVWQ
jgi:urease accessory protein